MAIATDIFDLGGLRLTSGEGRRLTLAVALDPIVLAGERYTVNPATLETRLDISRTTGDGYALRLSFSAWVAGPCMRCLGAAAPVIEVDAREVDRPGAGVELESPYMKGELLDLVAWARDAFLLAAPDQILCGPDCLGLCPECAVNLNEAESGHHHDRPPDPRWAKLRDLSLPAEKS